MNEEDNLYVQLGSANDGDIYLIDASGDSIMQLNLIMTLKNCKTLQRKTK